MKIKSLSIVLILISGTLFSLGPFVQESLGQIGGDENNNIPSPEERLEILLQILVNASEHIQNRLDELEEKNVIISEKAIERAENGLLKAQDAILKRNAGDIEGAINDALDAMHDFRESMEDIEKSIEDTDVDDLKDKAEKALGIAAKIQRTKILRDKLLDLVERRAEQGHDVSGLRIAIANANDRITRAEKLLEEGNLEESEDGLEDVTDDLEDIQEDELEEIAKSEKPDKAKKFLEKAIDRIEKLVKQFEGLQIPEDARQKILESLYSSLTKIEEARSLIDAGDVDDSIESIEDGIDDEDEALDEADKRVPHVGKPLKAIANLERVIDKFEEKLARIIVSLERNNVIVDILPVQTKIINAKSILEDASLSLANDIGLAEELKDLAEDLKDEIEDDLEDLEDLIKEHHDNAKDDDKDDE